MTQSEINNLQIGDVVTLSNPEGTFTVIKRGSFAVKDQVGRNRFIDLAHTPESLAKHPLPPAILEQGSKIKCHASLTFLQCTGTWVYGSLPLKPGQFWPDHQLAA